MELTTHLHLMPRFKERVELYLYSLLGVYGLFHGELYLLLLTHRIGVWVGHRGAVDVFGEEEKSLSSRVQSVAQLPY